MAIVARHPLYKIDQYKKVQYSHGDCTAVDDDDVCSKIEPRTIRG